MNYRKLGRTGLKVSELCLGTMQFGWTADEATSFAVLDAFVEAGGNFIDTADIYSSWAEGNPGGVSEQIIGRWLKARGNRGAIVLATKARGRMWDGPNGEGLSRGHLIRACEESLRRLDTDYIDLYQTHWFDADTPIDETMARSTTWCAPARCALSGARTTLRGGWRRRSGPATSWAWPVMTRFSHTIAWLTAPSSSAS